MKYTKEKLEEAVKISKSYAEVSRYFGVKPSTGAQSYITKKIKEFSIELHDGWLGNRSNLGKRSNRRKPAIDDCYKGSNINSHRLRERLIRDGVKEEKCEICENTVWLEEKIPLELDHINSDHSDNRLENLMILCPNCHAVETRKRKMPK